MKKEVVRKIFKIIIYLFALWGLLLTIVFFAMKIGLTKSSSLVDSQSGYFKELANLAERGSSDDRSITAKRGWEYIGNLPEWKVVKEGILKDREIISRVSVETGVDERLIITPLVAEQLRLMTSEREIFKKYFQPLSVLGSQTQFSLGIYGIKERTAREIEVNLKNKDSEYYLGSQYEHLLDYQGSSSTILVYVDTLEPVKNNSTTSTVQVASSTRATILLNGSDADRIKRLVDSKDHYYSYLYAALYMKQIMNSWQKAGYDISDRPEIVSTIYNIGFINSHPNPNPQVGGAEINLNGQKYSFGSIAFYFYFSDELKDVFSR